MNFLRFSCILILKKISPYSAYFPSFWQIGNGENAASDGKGEHMSGKMCRRYIGLLVGVLLLTAGCGSKKTTSSVNGGRNQLGKKAVESSTESSDKKFTMPYNISIKAVIMKLDTQAGIVQLKNTAGGLGYTLTYTNQTQVWDKYGGSKMMEEVTEGDLVEAYIDDSNGRLSGLIYSSENWEFQGSQNWSFNTEKSELMIGKEDRKSVV